MRGVYTVRSQIASLTAAKTVLLGTLPAGTLVEILEAYLTNADVSTIEQLNIGLFPITSLGTPTGTTLTVLKTESGSADTVVTWLGNITANEPTYSANPYHVEGVINVSGYRFEPAPEARRLVGSGLSFGLRLLNTPVTPFKAECLITYRELG